MSSSSIEILQEVQKLGTVCDHLDALAEQNPFISEALIRISESVRNTATLLKVLVAMKIGPLPEFDSVDA
jgi:hypothetical protein